MDNYQVFAAVYDDLMDKSLYAEWLKYVQKRVPTGQRILELASGAGDLAQRLVAEKYDLTVSDLSESMLELAASKVGGDSDTDFLLLDMLNFDFAAEYDAVICFDDSICYLKDEEQLRQTFQNVWRALKPGGQFLFDSHSLFQMDHVFPEYMFNEINEDYTFVWKSFIGEQPHSIVHDLQIFIPTDVTESEATASKFECFEEMHHERTYPIATYRKLLQEAQFELTELTTDFTDGFDGATGRRWFFQCRKVV
ncbi:SAM-dependent methyltransferase [Amylolactobacillus amylotrophicus DSM 20534]|uniref:Uncharacterized protein n=4 Tax=Amylolactobacillus TaxID=2767876 RepID=A0A1L6XAH2_9LACO|nr:MULTISPECIES: class I SAM-dependent methyltransferase [Amylolactobacillus]APT17978.1 hypothetical protein LA20533_00970 [Amylolactobacillus amylophilus DSM 20533 = JCM 1125]KRK37260.1 SAM-dependent methyltransferase [Amylolactobacillus amylotrophicus DSM 20534]KRM41659.1 SAM-dependent methyltransferase [Amylolactobacillus amylophilus DSM 20533 = JCM 1125]GED80742.1 SAM-dependent methyltransferase [Amylolactobacillus amylophilus]